MYVPVSPLYRYLSESEEAIIQRQFFSLCSYESWRVKKQINAYEQDDVYQDGTKWISHALLRVIPFTEDVYETIVRLQGGVMEPSDWGALFGEKALCGRKIGVVPCETVRWLLQRGVCVDWNTSRCSYPALYRILSECDDMEYMLLLLQDGANPNLSMWRASLLHTYLAIHCTMPDFHHAGILLRNVRFLLEHGADPMLADVHGKTVIDIVRDVHLYTNVPPVLQKELLSVLAHFS